MYSISFQTTDWNDLPETKHAGETGHATWRTRTYGDLRIRMVHYSENYRGSHWCKRGHILLCLEGELTTELEDGKKFHLKKGMSYEVSDDLSTHRSSTVKGATLFIVDGGFLKKEIEIKTDYRLFKG